MILKQIIIFFIFLIVSVQTYSQTGMLEIKITNIQSSEGNIKVALYNEESSRYFVFENDKAYRLESAEILGSTAYCKFKNVSYGKYAISLFHDKNNDSILNKAVLGYPIEPYGFSGKDRQRAVPDFGEAAFSFEKKIYRINITLESYVLSR